MTTKTTMVKFMLMVRPDVSFNNGQLHRKTVGCLSFPTIWVWGYQTES